MKEEIGPGNLNQRYSLEEFVGQYQKKYNYAAGISWDDIMDSARKAIMGSRLNGLN